VSIHPRAAVRSHLPARRLGCLILAAALVVAIALELSYDDPSYWLLAGFVMAPDIALFVGLGRGLAKGRLHPRAVGLYNALHRAVGPLLLAALASASLLPRSLFAGALVWAFHIALDRALGYGLRDRDGFQRA
jgi:hypothetical protein